MTYIDNPICVAIDTPDLKRAEKLADSVKNHVGMLKVGMEFFYAHGMPGYKAMAAYGIPLFLDLKLHDIPHTVAAGLSSLMQLEPKPAIIDVHATGGPAMLASAAKAVNGRAKLIAVTILTSLDDNDLSASGFDNSKNTGEHAASLALLAKANNIDGVVCSPHDLVGIRKVCGDDFLTIVPGIRPQGSDTQDQKRIATPRAAMDAGADILVIGRAITGANDPARATQEILDTLKS